MKPRWQRSKLVWPEAAMAFGDDDWTLTTEDGQYLARIFDAGRDDGFEEGNWRWRVYRPTGVDLGGSAETGADAKKIVEELLDGRKR